MKCCVFKSYEFDDVFIRFDDSTTGFVNRCIMFVPALRHIFPFSYFNKQFLKNVQIVLGKKISSRLATLMLRLVEAGFSRHGSVRYSEFTRNLHVSFEQIIYFRNYKLYTLVSLTFHEISLYSVMSSSNMSVFCQKPHQNQK